MPPERPRDPVTPYPVLCSCLDEDGLPTGEVYRAGLRVKTPTRDLVDDPKDDKIERLTDVMDVDD